MTFSRVFIANRGEIAVRIIRAAQTLGLETVAGVSAADREAMPARLADRTVVLGPGPAQKSYLDPRLIVHAARATGCDALHPGYGFLSERAELAELCEEHDIAFIGPRPDSIRRLGDKLTARALARDSGVPLNEGSEKLDDAGAAQAAAEALGFPVLIKASAGGGGRGMFIARSSADIGKLFERAATESRQAFGDGTLYLERYVENARHVEVQILGDGDGNVVHFGDRDCSIQRRYQKLVEESPCLVISDEKRAALHESALALTGSANYRNAGTVEFVYDVDRDSFFFIEVNSRIQVEHPVSEQVTGFDLIQAQFRVAAGEPLPVVNHATALGRHAIEMRINAEDAARDFLPVPGTVDAWIEPRGAGVRVDTHCFSGYRLPPYYDSLMAKLVVTASDREACVERLAAALHAFEIKGQTSNLDLQRAISLHEDFRANAINTRWLESTFLPDFAPPQA